VAVQFTEAINNMIYSILDPINSKFWYIVSDQYTANIGQFTNSRDTFLTGDINTASTLLSQVLEDFVNLHAQRYHFSKQIGINDIGTEWKDCVIADEDVNDSTSTYRLLNYPHGDSFTVTGYINLQSAISTLNSNVMEWSGIKIISYDSLPFLNTTTSVINCTGSVSTNILYVDSTSTLNVGDFPYIDLTITTTGTRIVSIEDNSIILSKNLLSDISYPTSATVFRYRKL
jgi:hypothetical protein